MATTKPYKACFVPLCLNTTKSAPDKIFLNVPQDVKRRNLWFRAARRVNPKSLSTYFCCEDHFDLAEDMENYVYYTMMGGPAKIKKTTVPHKFECQPDRKRRKTTAARLASEKRTRQKEIDEILRQDAYHSIFMDELDATEISTTYIIPEQSAIEDFTANTTKSILTASEREDTKVTAGTQTSVKHRSVAVQVNIQPKYRSVRSMCNIKKSTADKCCSPVKYRDATETVAPAENVGSQNRSTTVSSKDPCGSNFLYVSTDDSHFVSIKNETLVEEDATIEKYESQDISENSDRMDFFDRSFKRENEDEY